MRITDKFVLFWSGIYSNFYTAHFSVNGTLYLCSEQYFMAMKAKHFGDNNTQQLVMLATLPQKQKQLGRTVSGFNLAEWEKVREKYMYEGVYAKFAQNPELQKQLCSTKGKILVEASPVDRVWGIGMMETDSEVGDPSKWKGLNLLGKVLMKVREDLC